MTTLRLRNRISRSPLRHGFLFATLASGLACLALLPTAKAADGGLPGLNTAEGDFAVSAIVTNSAKTGGNNIAVGYSALNSDASGNYADH